MRIAIVSILGLSATALASPILQSASHLPVTVKEDFAERQFEAKRSPADDPLFAGDALSDIIQTPPEARPQTNQLSSTPDMNMPGWVETVAKVVEQSDEFGGRLGAGQSDLGGMAGFRPNGARPVKRSSGGKDSSESEDEGYGAG